jgi:hypothetical protein
MNPITTHKETETNPVCNTCPEASAPSHGATSLREAALQEGMRELESVVGLRNVKEQLRELVNVGLVAQQLSRTPDETGNIILTGDNDSENAAIARIVGKLLYGAGYLQNSIITAISSCELEEHFIGELEGKISQALEQAAGGMLFIDDISALRTHDRVQLGRALNRLEQENGGRVVIMLAGSQDGIEALFTESQGLSTQFFRHIQMPDYTPPEMTITSKQLLESQNFDVSAEFYTRALVLTSIMALEQDSSRWNRPFVRNEIVQGSIQQLASRVMQSEQPLTDDALRFIQPDDLPFKKLTGIPWSVIDRDQLQWELKRENGDVIQMDADTVGQYFANMTDHRVLDEGQPELTPASKQYLAELVETVN